MRDVPALDAESRSLDEDEDVDGLGERRLQARVRHAAGTRTWVAGVLFEAEERPGRLDPAVRDVLLAPTTQPPRVAQWTHEAPLVLLDVATAYTDRPSPAGNIVWLRPASAAGYLRSLASAGVIMLAMRS